MGEAGPGAQDTRDLVLRHAGDVLCVVDLVGRISWASPSAAPVIGWAAQDLVGRAVDALVHPSDLPLLGAVIDRTLPDGSAEYRLRTGDGRWLWVEDRVRAVREGAGPVEGFVLTLRDVHERHEVQERLQEANELFELAFRAAPIGKALVSPDGRWLRVNPAMCRLTGRDEADLLGCTFQDITHPEDLDTDLGLLREVLAGERDDYQMEKRYVRPNGDVVWVLLAVAVARHDDGAPNLLIAQVKDIGDRKAAEQRLHHMANHDALTGLWNRARLSEELARCVHDMDRHGTAAVLVLLDLDRFKSVNDSEGHAVGDQLLQAVAETMRAGIRVGDSCARPGGDEFAVVLPLTDLTEAKAIVGRVVEAIATVSAAHGVTASAGVAPLRRGQGVDAWLRAADAAMYAVKRSGGNGLSAGDGEVETLRESVSARPQTKH